MALFTTDPAANSSFIPIVHTSVVKELVVASTDEDLPHTGPGHHQYILQVVHGQAVKYPQMRTSATERPDSRKPPGSDTIHHRVMG